MNSQTSAELSRRDDPIEMGLHPRMLARVRRLALVSSVALGVIFIVALATTDASPAIVASLALGWLLMPTFLAVSLKRPRVRYLLTVPSVLVSVGLLAIVLTSFHPGWLSKVGWLMTTTGVALGGVLGLWFWYRLVPVPDILDDPFSRARWTLISTHVLLIVLGQALVIVAQYVG